MIRGSCLCGALRFEADEVALLSTCHCSMCRKQQGAAFGVFASVRADAFRWLAGEGGVQRYRSSPDNERAFCGVCGAAAPSFSESTSSWVVPAGLLDDDPGKRIALHMFVGSKAPWWEIADTAPQFEAFVPGFGPDDPH